jgi:hypothetical protein
MTKNCINNKIYVGVHKTHTLDDGYLGSGLNLQRAINKYGEENFQRVILHYCHDEVQMFEFESLIVDQHFINRNDTYNIAIGGYGGWYIVSKLNVGRKHSIDSRKKRSLKLKGLKRTPEQRKRISESQKIIWDDARKLHFSLLAKNRTEDHKRKLSEALKGRSQSEECISNRVAKNTGQKRSDEQKQRISSSLKGKGKKGSIKYVLIDPSLVVHTPDCLKEFCETNDLPYRILLRKVNTGIIAKITNKKNKAHNWANCIGWQCSTQNVQ